MIDLDFLLPLCPALAAARRVVVIHGEARGDRGGAHGGDRRAALERAAAGPLLGRGGAVVAGGGAPAEGARLGPDGARVAGAPISWEEAGRAPLGSGAAAAMSAAKAADAAAEAAAAQAPLPWVLHAPPLEKYGTHHT